MLVVGKVTINAYFVCVYLSGKCQQQLCGRECWCCTRDSNQSLNLFVQKCNTHWTGHQGRMQPPL